MGATKPEKADKKEKKDKKRAEADGVTKPSKKDKKEKKEKKDKLKSAVANAELDETLQADAAASASAETAPAVTEMEVEQDGVKEKQVVVGALVPFARPLADDKAAKKVLKSVRKAAKNKTLKRGVKEVVKALRKSPASGPTNQGFPGVVVLAGDISPMDVISHIPVLCEDVNVPYIFVTSRAELGAAGSTKRPTSVVMVTEKRAAGGAGKKGAETITEEDAEEFAEVYKDLVKLVQKESKQLKF